MFFYFETSSPTNWPVHNSKLLRRLQFASMTALPAVCARDRTRTIHSFSPIIATSNFCLFSRRPGFTSSLFNQQSENSPKRDHLVPAKIYSSDITSQHLDREQTPVGLGKPKRCKTNASRAHVIMKPIRRPAARARGQRTKSTSVPHAASETLQFLYIFRHPT